MDCVAYAEGGYPIVLDPSEGHIGQLVQVSHTSAEVLTDITWSVTDPAGDKVDVNPTPNATSVVFHPRVTGRHSVSSSSSTEGGEQNTDCVFFEVR